MIRTEVVSADFKIGVVHFLNSLAPEASFLAVIFPQDMIGSHS